MVKSRKQQKKISKVKHFIDVEVGGCYLFVLKSLAAGEDLSRSEPWNGSQSGVL